MEGYALQQQALQVSVIDLSGCRLSISYCHYELPDPLAEAKDKVHIHPQLDSYSLGGFKKIKRS
jgi:hypothetical protein